MKPLPLCLLCLSLASCVLGPEPGAPDAKAPQRIRGDASPHGASFGDKAWREVFQDPTLRQLIERATTQNPDLLAATYRIEQARAGAAAARSSWFPQINGGAGASANYGSINGGQIAAGSDRDSESYDLTGFLSWELDLWGGIRRSNEAARARLLEAEYARDAIQTTIVAAVASAYIELKNLDERLAISRRTAKSREASLEIVTARRDGGVSSDLEVAQANSLLQEALTAIPITEQAIAAKENEIRFLLGDYPAGIVRAGNLDSLDSAVRIHGGLPSSLLQRRPDLAAAEQAFRAAVADIGVAQALRLPNLSLTGSGGAISSQFDKLLEGDSGAYSIGPQLVGPIFDAGRSKARAESARARAEEARAEYDRAAKLAFREAADGINAHAKTGEIVTSQSRLLSAQQKASSVAKERFEGGKSSYLEVLDAERNLFSSELRLADARRDRLLSVVQTYRALGGGWK